MSGSECGAQWQLPVTLHRQHLATLKVISVKHQEYASKESEKIRQVAAVE